MNKIESICKSYSGLDLDAVKDILADEVKITGSVRELAEEIGMNTVGLHQALQRNKSISIPILNYLGLQKRIIYERKVKGQR